MEEEKGVGVDWQELEHFRSPLSEHGVRAGWVLGSCQFWELGSLPQGLCQRTGRAAYRLWAAWGLTPAGRLWQELLGPTVGCGAGSIPGEHSRAF